MIDTTLFLRERLCLGDLVAQLVKAHRDIEGRLCSLAEVSGPAALAQEVRELGAVLARHTSLELEIFYPVADALLAPEGLRFVPASAVEHEAIMGLVAMSEQSRPGEPSYLPRIDVLGRHLAQHFAEEESVLFQALETRGFGTFTIECFTEAPLHLARPAGGRAPALH